MRVHVLENDSLIRGMFLSEGHELVPLEAADILVYPGGPDVPPGMYGDDPHPTTHYDFNRNERFIASCHKWAGLGKGLQVGICGGGQFLNCMYGGVMYQDVDNHAIRGTHACTYVTEKGEIETHQVTSTHHQQMIGGLRADIWGYAKLSTYRDRGTDNRRRVPRGGAPDMEILFYWSDDESRYPAALCFQPHPEYGMVETKDLFFRCLTRALKEQSCVD